MFDRGYDQPLNGRSAVPPQARRQRQHVRLGTARREDDVPRLRADSGRNFTPGPLDPFPRFAPLGMNRGCVARKVQRSRDDAPRFFEALVRGRGYLEVPDITSRICGICPIAYLMSTCRALEGALGLQVDGQLRALRRLPIIPRKANGNRIHSESTNASCWCPRVTTKPNAGETGGENFNSSCQPPT